jgi:hypothetical protein
MSAIHTFNVEAGLPTLDEARRPFGHQPPMRDASLNGPVQRGTIRARLAAGSDFLNHEDGLHCDSVSVETEIVGNRKLLEQGQRNQRIL